MTILWGSILNLIETLEIKNLSLVDKIFELKKRLWEIQSQDNILAKKRPISRNRVCANIGSYYSEKISGGRMTARY